MSRSSNVPCVKLLAVCKLIFKRTIPPLAPLLQKSSPNEESTTSGTYIKEGQVRYSQRRNLGSTSPSEARYCCSDLPSAWRNTGKPLEKPSSIEPVADEDEVNHGVPSA